MPGISLAYGAATFVSTLVGGFFALRFASWMDRIMAFSGGVLMAAGLLDLLPEAVTLQVRAGSPVSAKTFYPPLFAAVIGFLFFYLVERMSILRSVHSHHHHPDMPGLVRTGNGAIGDESAGGENAPAREQHPPSPVDHNHSPPAHSDDRHSHQARSDDRHSHGPRYVGILGAAGLCIHSLLDGFSIGAAFRANASLGVLVAAAVIAHDFSDGVSTVALVLSNRNSRAVSVIWLLVDALAPLVGVGLAALLTLSLPHLGDLLGWFAGMFLYLGATHMLPEAHAISDSGVTVAWMVAGVALIVVVTQLIG